MNEMECPLCLPDRHTLEETDQFRVVADHHPLTEGHLLIVPKEHISCAGAFPEGLRGEFLSLYRTCMERLRRIYGTSVATFEHGNVAQTVFHSHTHLLPFSDDLQNIKEADEALAPIDGLEDLKRMFATEGQYLFVANADAQFVLQTQNIIKAIFRIRFSKALGVPERGEWRAMHQDAALMATAEKEIALLKEKWKS